jgi:hypothetical protein
LDSVKEAYKDVHITLPTIYQTDNFLLSNCVHISLADWVFFLNIKKCAKRLFTWVGGLRTTAFPAMSAGAILDTAKFTG